ncbi:HAMP domain-containing methyl-accepting chemotaxis protein [Marinobacter sp.]|uniref:HAMP domain-containing methyl-accepting chemotaxis protein n=1 Tax=Marinobacter sp. TaxID=50741 RepID=UPI003A936E86
MSVSRFYRNLSIGLKLTAGFSTLIVLAVIISLVGLKALDTYDERSNTVTIASALESNLLSAKINETRYLLDGNEADIDQAKSRIDTAFGYIDTLKQRLVVDADRATLEAIEEGVHQYRQLLDEMVLNIKARNDATEALSETAFALEGRIGIEDDLYAANALLRQIRQYERNFLVNHDQDVIKTFDVTSERALATINRSRLDDVLKQPIVEMFNSYLSAFHDTVELLTKSLETRELVEQTTAASIAAASDLQDIQLQQMKQDRVSAMVLILSAAGIVIALGALLSWMLTRSITRPVREAVAFASTVASGDLRARISSDRGDEFGQLLTALGMMVTSLRDLVQEINTSANEIASSAEELSTVTDQTSAGIGRQRDQTDQVATALNEMVATVNEVARSAEEAFSAAGSASDKAGVGEKAVGDTLSLVASLHDEVSKAVTRIQGLQADTQNIGSVLDVIKSVADQTNLLALNAAIEAARAGDQGRGFAVVADEVRALAQRTQNSASEIDTLITQLVNSAAESVKTMEAGAELANRTLDNARDTGQSITAIASAVNDIRQHNSQIATAAEQQTSVAEEINQNVTAIRDISDQSATSANQVAGSSNELARLAENLRDKVSRFSV